MGALKRMSNGNIIKSEVDRTIVNYLRNYKKDYSLITSEEIANECNVSQASVTRFAKKIGYSGFRELKYNLVNTSNVYEKDFEHEYINNLKIALSEINKEISHETIKAAVNEILKADKIYLFAYGGTFITSLDFSYKLKRLGLEVSCETDSHYKFVSAKNAKPGSVAICISYSGETSEIDELLKILTEKNIFTVYATSNPKNNVDYNMLLPIPKTDEFDRVLSLTSRITLLAIFDMICVEILKRDPLKYSEKLTSNRM